jgi:hypothetical protein
VIGGNTLAIADMGGYQNHDGSRAHRLAACD